MSQKNASKTNQKSRLDDIETELKAMMLEVQEVYRKLCQARDNRQNAMADDANYRSGITVIGFKPENLVAANREFEAMEAEHKRIRAHVDALADLIDEARLEINGK